MRRYDFWLVMITIALLAGLGLLAFGGTLYTWRAEVTLPGWSSGAGYRAYTEIMNGLAAPLVASLVVVLGLCIPRRLFERQALWAASAAMVGASVVVSVVGGLMTGVTLFLIVAAVLQVVAVVLTGARLGRVSYLGEGIVYQTGSAVLHLGFIVLVLDWVSLPDSSWHLPIFWVGTALLVAGSAMCFYRRALGGRGEPH